MKTKKQITEEINRLNRECVEAQDRLKAELGLDGDYELVKIREMILLTAMIALQYALSDRKKCSRVNIESIYKHTRGA